MSASAESWSSSLAAAVAAAAEAWKDRAGDRGDTSLVDARGALLVGNDDSGGGGGGGVGDGGGGGVSAVSAATRSGVGTGGISASVSGASC